MTRFHKRKEEKSFGIHIWREINVGTIYTELSLLLSVSSLFVHGKVKIFDFDLSPFLKTHV
jgi:hypothetical protein